MFHHFFCTRLLRISISQHSTTTYVFSLQNPYLKFISTLSDPKNQPSFTVSYLVNSCGLSEAAALLAAKKVSIETAEKPDSVLCLLNNYDFEKTHISKFITKYPLLLLLKPDKTLKPKLEFFRDLGLSGPNLAKILCSNPYILGRSLKKHIMPSIDFLRLYLCTNENIIFALRRSSGLLQPGFQKRMVSNVSTLQKVGVPEQKISKLIMTQPTAMMVNPDRFIENIMAIKEMGFDPLKSTFIKAVFIMSAMTKLNWEAKLEVYRSEGWSENEILYAFKMQPICMGISEKKIRKVSGYFVNKMGWKPSVISKNPNILGLSFEKRIHPRCSVLQILIAEGLIDKDSNLAWALLLTEKDFREKFVIKNQEKVPKIQRVYQSMIGAVELDKGSKELEIGRVEPENSRALTYLTSHDGGLLSDT
ncbi:transcription termination factor MTERF8, chloroplastic-like [Tasmannia lanceolata]|uniref:transcription termination factor MTERF8, chloroplastic-like n=1 Tax=Tasmannia lanceolata TaxID=3420 RepID=UPI00406347FC